MNYLNLHIIRPIPYSNLNRDDTGAPKSLVYGGQERGRISSQALSRAIKVTYETETPGDTTFRSKLHHEHITDEVIAQLTERGIDVDDETRDRIRNDARKKVLSYINKASNSDGDPNTLIWFAEAELRDYVIRRVQKYVDGADDDIEGPVSMPNTRSLSIAMRGRMFAAAAEVQTDAAMQVAHAFTTHPHTVELDYFTAVDDMLATRDPNNKGAGHLEVGQFTSGVFYQHATLDRRQLRHNWLDISSDAAAERLRSWFRSALTALPRGKTNSTAPTTLPSWVAVVPATQPLSLAAAFERPVEADATSGYEQPSVDRINSYLDTLNRAYPNIHGNVAVLDLHNNGANVTFDDVVEQAVAWALEGSEAA